jgi:hypothetical protein
LKSFNILILLVLISSLFPYQVGADTTQPDVQVPLTAIQEGSGYFSGKVEQVQSVPRLEVSGNLYAPGEEVVEKRTENSKTTYLGKVGKDDKYALDVSMGAIHYKDDYNSGEQWKDIDLTFENGKITKAPYELTVDGQSITVRDKKTGSIVALTLSEIGSKSVSTPTLTYSKGLAKASNIALDTDLEIVADNSRIKFTRVMKSAMAPAECKFGLSQTGVGIKVDYKAVDSSKEVAVTSSLKNGVLTESVSKVGVSYPLRIDPTIDIGVGASADDAYFSTDSTDGDLTSASMSLGIVPLGPIKSAGMRFTNITIPSYGTIAAAHITMTGQDDFYHLSSVDIYGEQSNAAAVFSTMFGRLDFEGRANTTAKVDWDNIHALLNEVVDSPDIKTIVSELVSDYSGLSSANIVFKYIGVSDWGRFYQWDGSTTKCAQLHIEYTISATISTISSSMVEETTTTVGGNVTAMGSGNITSYGVQYGLSGSYGLWCNTTATKTAIFSYYCYLGTNTSALNEGTLYYYRAWAYDNVMGYSYGSQSTFLTKPIEPNTLNLVTMNSTAISYTFNKGTGAVYTYIRYKDGSYPANITDGTETYNGTGTSGTQGSLTDAHTYYFRAWSWVSNTTLSQYSDATANASALTFDPPTVTTAVATLVGETTATTGGTITVTPFALTTWGVQYGTTGSYGSWSNTSSNPVLPYAFTKNLTSLTKGELYYFRAFAEHALGTGYGSQLTFLTKPDPPVLMVTAYNTTALSLSWAVGTGSDYTYIRYSNVTYPLTIADGTLAGNYTAVTTTDILNGLTSLSTYYFSAWGHSTGGGMYQFSNTYSTASAIVPGAPTVTTNSPTGYGNDWASVSGTQTGGYPASTLFGFQYGNAPGIYTGWSNTTTTILGGFSATISELTPSSSYYYRAFAMNAYGTGYGGELSFSTGGTAVLYESHMLGCNTTWSQVYESDAASVNLTSWVATPVYGNNWTAQTFTTTQAHSVHQVVLWASRTATAAGGYVYVSIRDATTDVVTSPDLGIGLYAIAYVSQTGGPIEVSLENEIQLDANKKYAIVVRAPAADTTYYVSMYSSNITGGSIYAGGNAVKSTTGGSTWTSYTNYDFYFSIIGRPQPIYGNIQAAQTFTVGTAAHTAYKVRLILGRIGQPGNIYVSIRNYTGGVISNADLAVVALNGNAITLDKASYDCVLVPEKSLEANKQYAIVVMAPSGDRYNYILICADSGAGYAGGTALQSSNSGISWVVQTFDYNFEIWGNACLNVLNAKVFKNYLVTGDWLITAETLNVSPPYYDSNQDPSTLFILSFMGLTGTTYASTPCESWEKGPIAIYLNPTQASALTWGGNYKVRLGDLSGTVYSEYGLLSTDWNASSLTYLDNWVRLCAKDMEAYQTAKTGTTISYLTYVADKGYCLNQNGGAIFNQACPRLSYVRPNLFQVTSNQPTIDNTVVATPGATTSTTYQVRLGSYLSGLIDQAAGAMGVSDPKTAGGLIIVAIYFIIAFGTVVKGFAWAGIIAAFPVVLMGMYYGLLDVQMILVIIVILVVLFVREFFWKGG